MATIYDKNAQVFKALCDPKRLAILELLQSGEKCACMLIDALDIGQSGLSYHMKILCESDIVASRQEGKWTHYKISPTGSEKAMLLLKSLTTANTNIGTGTGVNTVANTNTGADTDTGASCRCRV